MQNIKIIFSDIDGTLLDGNRELAEDTIEQIQRVSSKYKIPFILVSARTPSGLEHLYKQLDSADPAICYNGALILEHLYDWNLDELTLSSNSVEYKPVLWIQQKAKEYKIHTSIYSTDSWVTDERDYWTQREESNTKTKAIISNTNDFLYELMSKNQPIHKVMLMGDSQKLDKLESESNKLFSDIINVYRSKDTYIEITPKSVNKATGCQFILKRLGINPEFAIAFGDNYNDIDMLSYVGVGVAMDNAPEEVKKVAKMVAPSNKLNGVATVLNKIFP